jgi:hypothetical protein
MKKTLHETPVKVDASGDAGCCVKRRIIMPGR